MSVLAATWVEAAVTLGKENAGETVIKREGLLIQANDLKSDVAGEVGETPHSRSLALARVLRSSGSISDPFFCRDSLRAMSNTS